MAPKVLFTGFVAFLDHKRNPSWDVAQSAALSFGEGGSARLLDVSFAGVREAAAEPLDAELVVAIGLASTECVRVEQVAKNLGGAVRDNDGVVHQGPLEPGGPEFRVTEVARGVFYEALVQASPVEVVESSDAGEYVCNALLFHLLKAREQGGPEAVFVHVPQLGDEQAAAVGRAVAAAARAWLDAR